MILPTDADGVNTADPDPGEIMSHHDVARIVGCHTRTVRRMIADGTLPAFRLGKKILVRRCDFDAMIANALAEGVAPVGQVRAARLADLDHEGGAQ